MIKLIGRISVSLDAECFMDAAEHEKRLETFLAEIRKVYPDAQFEIGQRRDRKPLGLRKLSDPVPMQRYQAG
ncbi:hypothetical protein [Phenylobacterium sp.]|uniref:hypothetical protein n=1 Tax=Phenylobacterium sp. TaxID=1871053 RepID=UPI00121C32E8|nr:hypothetical protein [Phenylobacterium sp.]THD60099.1 MAG: hypothetical protein E8A49_14975 [Phenylobacterium sp.]